MEAAYQKVDSLGGILIPAHVNRAAYGLLPVLGFFPHGIEFPIVEISSNLGVQNTIQNFPQITGHSLIMGGDAHNLNDIRGLNEFIIEAPSIKEIIKAGKGVDGRSVSLLV